MATSPNADNYTIPTGKAFFTPSTGINAGQRTDLGNVVNFAVSADVKTKDHFRNYGGVRSKDKTRITEAGFTGKATVDEITAFNLSFFALSDVEEVTDGVFQLKGLSKTTFEGLLEIVGDNDEGTQSDWEGEVSFVPSGDFTFIKDNDDYNQINLQFTVLADSDGNFGTWTIREA
jgi:hypothetical protein